jgi:hypothetical protein
MGFETPQIATEDESQRVEDVEKAQEMAEAGDEDRTKIEEEKKINDGKEFSVWKNLETSADFKENLAGAEYDMRKKAEAMSNLELRAERAKMAALAEVLAEEEKSRGLR